MPHVSAMLAVLHLEVGNRLVEGPSLCHGDIFCLGEDLSFNEDSLS